MSSLITAFISTQRSGIHRGIRRKFRQKDAPCLALHRPIQQCINIVIFGMVHNLVDKFVERFANRSPAICKIALQSVKLTLQVYEPSLIFHK
jgi:hypothetical protein